MMFPGSSLDTLRRYVTSIIRQFPWNGCCLMGEMMGNEVASDLTNGVTRFLEDVEGWDDRPSLGR